MSVLSRLRFPSGIIPTIAATTAILCLGGGIPHAQAAGPDTSTSATGVPAASKASPSSQTLEPPAHAPGPAPSPADMRTVTDDDGKTVKIPSSPERIVVMHEPLLGIPLMDLGLAPIGAYGRNREGGFVTAVDFIDTVFGPGHAKPQGFGALGQINLERLRTLKGLNPNNMPKNMPGGGGMPDMSALEGMMGQGGMPDMSALGGAGMPDMSQMFGGGLKGKAGEFLMRRSMNKMAKQMKKNKKKRK